MKKVIALVLILLLIGTISISCLQTNNYKTTTATPKSKPTPSPSPVATEPPIIYSIGEAVIFDDIEVTVNKVSFLTHAGGFSQLKKADNGFVYCVIYIDVKNLTTKSLDLGNNWPKSGIYSFKLIHDGENEYLGTFYDKTDFFDGNKSIPAKGTLKDKILNFLVPIEIKDDGCPLELRLSYNSIWKDGLITWKLR